MKCPKCNKAELNKGPKKIEPDGTEYFVLNCPSCNNRFMDIKMPHSAIIEEATNPKPETLVQWLIESGLNVDKELAEKIKNTPETTPLLIDVLKTNKYWQKENEGDGWAPFHSLHLLSAMKANEAIPTIIDILRYKPDELGDWLTEEIGSILANFGKPIVSHLMGFIMDERNNEFARGAATSALVVIYLRDEENNKELLKWFNEYLDKLIKNEDESLTFFADDLLELQDPILKEKIKIAFDKQLIDIDMFTWEDVEFVYNNPRDLFHDKDPMDHFNRENINHLLKVNYPDKIKVGKNQPCPCGSGKKYKLCCMEKESE